MIEVVRACSSRCTTCFDRHNFELPCVAQSVAANVALRSQKHHFPEHRRQSGADLTVSVARSEECRSHIGGGTNRNSRTHCRNTPMVNVQGRMRSERGEVSSRPVLR